MNDTNILKSANFSKDPYLKKILNKCHEITSDEIVSVGYGFKRTNGQFTSEKSIIFGVKRKLPIEEVNERDLIPSKIDILGGSIKTDVIERPKILAATNCNGFSSDWKTNPPSNRNKIRPIQSGTSAVNSTDRASHACTLGFLARDNSDNSIVGVTNIHCSASEPFSSGYGSYFGVYAANELIQPSEQYGSLNIEIGFLKRLKYLNLQDYNYSDVSIYSLLPSELSEASTYAQHNLNITANLPFATTSELDNLLDIDPLLYSSGRTTGAKGEGLVKLRVSQIHSSLTIGGYGSSNQSVDFKECISFIATPSSSRPFDTYCDNPIYPGDSGSALIADINGIKKIIGLVFAANMGSNEQVTEGYACRIDKVASDICISQI